MTFKSISEGINKGINEGAFRVEDVFTVEDAFTVSRETLPLFSLRAAAQRAFKKGSLTKIRDRILRIEGLKTELFKRTFKLFKQIKKEAEFRRKMDAWGLDLHRGKEESNGDSLLIDELGLQIHLPRSIQMAHWELKQIADFLPGRKIALDFLNEFMKINPSFIHEKTRMIAKGLSEGREFKVIEQIGQGAQATVYLMKDPNGEFCVKKCPLIQKNSKPLIQENSKTAVNEAKMLAAINEANESKMLAAINESKMLAAINDIQGVIHILGVTPQGYPILEFAPNSFRSLSPVSIAEENENEAGKREMRELAVTLSCLHGRGIVHRDIKNENILRDDSNRPKIADFGYAVSCPEEKIRKGMKGTPYYMAPEVIRNEPYDAKADVWSLGVLYYNLKTGGKYPHLQEDLLPDPISYLYCVGLATTPPKLGKINEAPLKDLLTGMLEPNPEKRLSIDDVVQHPYFSH
ncbi:MAG: hypothetical protein A3G30_04050 [Chlamydiae bacterium RIFCSPLOWO2_12_FULL_49_12]|nr:MAG: hypothetical protein A3G30_04050 [Chlamydiae bacterium RIFCSPLOWO2_12_FULL_49_12]